MKSLRRESRPPTRTPSAVPPSTTRKALLIDGSDQQFRAFIDDFVRLSARLQGLRQALARRMGMTPPQYNILMVLARAGTPEGMTMSTIAGRLRVSLSFVVSQARTLERMGLIDLRRNPADRRSVLTAITPAGRRRIMRAAPQIQRVNDLLFASLTRRELEATRRVIERVLKGGEAAALALKEK